MRILLLAHSFNSLCQRIHVELAGRGHELSLELDIHPEVFEEAVAAFSPDLVIAPFLKRAIPESVWRRVPCFVVHPGPVGDRGPSALDWAILREVPEWGVTVLQANAVMDGGDVWSWRTFPMRKASKGSLYRNEVSGAAVAAVLEAVERFAAGDFRPWPADSVPTSLRGRENPPVRQRDRRIDWSGDSTADVLRKIRSGDGNPGVEDVVEGVSFRLFDAHEELFLFGAPGELIARRAGAVCRATRDGAVWLGHLQRCATGRSAELKLPAVTALGGLAQGLPESDVDFWRRTGTWQDIAYEELAGVGYLHFDFYNGAMGVGECGRLEAALAFIRTRPVRLVALLGGHDFWSNGIHLGLIENAASAAEASWENIRAMNRVARAVLTDTSRFYVAALRGNAGSGGCFLALSCDRVVARRGVVLNPHYKNMGNLYGSEFWTYVLPRRVGEAGVARVMQSRLPVGAPEACDWGLLDAAWGDSVSGFMERLRLELETLAESPSLAELVSKKRMRREADEGLKPLDAYESEELARMHRNFFGFDPSYHVARFNFIRKVPHSRTPLHLAVHRRRRP